MDQVIGRGTLLIEDPARLDPARLVAPADGCSDEAAVTALGVDETAFLRATGTHATLFATGIADLTRAGRRGCWTWSRAPKVSLYWDWPLS
jgi:hypothetical protein